MVRKNQFKDGFIYLWVHEIKITSHDRDKWLQELKDFFSGNQAKRCRARAEGRRINTLVDVVLTFCRENDEIEIEDIVIGTIKRIQAKSSQARNTSFMRVQLVCG